jgi:hypothetical protein
MKIRDNWRQENFDSSIKKQDNEETSRFNKRIFVEQSKQLAFQAKEIDELKKEILSLKEICTSTLLCVQKALASPQKPLRVSARHLEVPNVLFNDLKAAGSIKPTVPLFGEEKQPIEEL